MPQPQALPGQINGDAIDRYTLGHGAAGILMGLGRLPWWGALGLAVGWEIVERPLKDQFPKAFPNATQDTVPNAVCDALAVMVGFALVKFLFNSEQRQ